MRKVRKYGLLETEVSSRLHLHGSNAFSFTAPLRLNYTHGSTVHKKGIVHLSGAGGKLPYSNANRSRQIQPFHILNDPARLFELLVDHLSGMFFRSHSIIPPAKRYTPPR
jgi:hypothetical protein